MNVPTNNHENGVVPQSARRERHCSYCNSTNHIISKCSAYMDSIHQTYLEEYTNSTSPSLFRPYGRAILKRQLRLLALKNGLPAYDSRLETIEFYYDKLHAHYLRLGIARRNVRTRIDRILQGMYAASPYMQELSQDVEPQYLEEVARRLEGEFDDVAPRRDQTVQLHLDASKFESKETSGECPVCLEFVENMVTTKCNHLFCQTCILSMLKVNCRNLSCAMCRGSVKDIYVHSQESMNALMN